MSSRIVHLTSVHPRGDIRVFLKICCSIACNNYDITLVVADGQGSVLQNGVSIIDVGVNESNRIKRMTKTVNAVYKKALELDASIYHFHDPELIPVGLLLKRKGKKVIFDSHEDFTSDILHKQYIPILVRRIISYSYSILERFAAKRFDAIVAATPKIASVFEAYSAKKVVNINNYPLLTELFELSPWENKSVDAVFVGAISSVRGVLELVRALDYAPHHKITIAGIFANAAIEKSIRSLDSWPQVDFLGQISRNQVFELLAKTRVGVVTYLPAPNHTDSQPNKLFEYMSAGIPVVASHFPLWKEIIESNDCGICVDPENSKEVSEAIQYLIDNPERAIQMGANGRAAVENKYNWTTEEAKLINLYEELLK